MDFSKSQQPPPTDASAIFQVCAWTQTLTTASGSENSRLDLYGEDMSSTTGPAEAKARG